MKNKTNTIYKSILTILLISSISACGGGGSGDDNVPKSNGGTGSAGGGKTTQTMTVSPSVVTLSVGELTNDTFNVTASNSARDITVTNNYTGDSTVTTTVNGDVVTVAFDSSDVITDEDASFKITVTDGTTTKTVSVNAVVTNTSGNIIADNLELTAAKIINGKLHAETESVMTVYNQIAILTGGYSKAKFTRFLSDFQAKKNNSNTTIENSGTNPKEITVRVADYRSGALTELDISAFSNELSAMLIDNTKELIDIINQVASKSDKLTPIPEYKYNITASEVSIYTGNELMGEFIDDSWVFNAEFSIASRAITNPCSAQ
jgi:hypothetical protein